MGDLRIHELQDFKYNFNLDTFIETGTFHGDGVAHALNYFDTIHSIEIDKELAQDAIERFKDNPGVHIHLGTSVEVLELLLPNIDGNILFWLDAHFPGADAHKVRYDNEPDMDIRAPLSRELELISQLRPNKKDVMIIDDLWMYEDGPFAWGSFDSHAKKCNLDINLETIMKGATLDSFYAAHEDTHNFTKRYEHQGYLIVTPK